MPAAGGVTGFCTADQTCRGKAGSKFLGGLSDSYM